MFIKDERGNTTHVSCEISKEATIGKNNYFGPGVNITKNVKIGDNNYFHSYVSVGSKAEHKDHEIEKSSEDNFVYIGNNNTFREFITINKPINKTGMTIISDNCYIMRGGHISHDSVVEDDVIMSCNVVLGGHTRLMRGAYMGINSCTHPKLIIGSYCIAGMGAVVTKSFPPGLKLIGIPAQEKGMNEVGLQRANLGPHILDLEASRFAEFLSRSKN